MKTLLYTTLAIGAFWLSGCTGSRMSSRGEIDDVYATSADYKADAQVYNTVDDATTNERDVASYSASDDYDQSYAAKNADRRGDYVEDPDPYGQDDYYYSRRIRRFNTNGFNYYDPYFAYDPYYAIGTPSWSAYNNSPWWYDPYYYNGPSFAWTYNWGAPGYAFYPSYYSWNRPWWNSPYGYGYGNGWSVGYSSWYGGGFGNYYGGYSGFYGGGFGGYGGNYWSGGYNPYCPPGGFGYSGFGSGFAGNSGGTSTTNFGPRNNMSGLNTTNNPNGSGYENPRSVRPYQGNFPVTSSVTNTGDQTGGRAAGTATPVRGNTGTVGSNPRSNPVRTATPSTYSTPRSSDTYTRPATETPRNYTRPATSPQEITPRNNTATPREVTPRNNATPPRQATPSRSYDRPSRSGGGNNNYSAPSRSSGSFSSPSPSRSSGSSSGGSFSSPSRSSGSSSGSSSGGRRR